MNPESRGELTTRKGGGFAAHPVRLQWAAGLVTLIVAATVLISAVPPRPIVLAPSQLRPERSHTAAWVVRLADPAWSRSSDTLVTPRRSTLQITEDGIPLGPAHSVHETIRTQGKGMFSNWGDELLFSTSDGTDPRSNGRKYELSLAYAPDLRPLVATLFLVGTLFIGHLTTRRFHFVLFAIVMLALMVRLTIAWELRLDAMFLAPPPGTDAEGYIKTALQIAEGRHPSEYYMQPLYYAVFLPILFQISPLSVPVTIAASQAVLAALTVYMTGLLAALLGGRRAGLIGAAILALSFNHSLYAVFGQKEILFAFLISAAALSATLCVGTTTHLSFAWMGLLLGVTALANGNAVFLVPGVGAAMLLRASGCSALRRTWGGALLLCCYLAVQLPFSLANYRSQGHWVGPATAFENTLAHGNTPQAPAGGIDYPPLFVHWVNGHPVQNGKPVSVSELSLQWMQAQPLAWIELKFRSLLLFLSAREVSTGLEARSVDSFLLSRVLLPSWVAPALGVAGIILCLRRRSVRSWLNAYLALALVVSYCVVIVQSRYRVGTAPLMAVWAGILVGQIAARVERPFRRAVFERGPIIWLVLGVLLAGVTTMAFDGYQAWLEPILLQKVRPNGVFWNDAVFAIAEDCGARPAGQWQPLAIPADKGALKITKTLVIPVASPPGRPPLRRLEIPLMGRGLVSAVVFGELRGRASLRLDGFGLQWMQIKVNPLSEKFTGRVSFDIVLSAQGTNATTFIDQGRLYGRTRISAGFLPLTSGTRATTGEFCIRLRS